MSQRNTQRMSPMQRQMLLRRKGIEPTPSTPFPFSTTPSHTPTPTPGPGPRLRANPSASVSSCPALDSSLKQSMSTLSSGPEAMPQPSLTPRPLSTQELQRMKSRVSPQQAALLRQLKTGEPLVRQSHLSVPLPVPPPPPAPPPASLGGRPVLSPGVSTYRPPAPDYGRRLLPRKALLIGIGYAAHRALPTLAGCRNDVLNMFNLLVRQLGFAQSSIHVLCDELETVDEVSVGLPTSVNILKGIDWLTQGVKAGESVVFFFAGHGDYVADVSGDEETGFDQCIMPMDYEIRPAHEGGAKAWRGASAILDDTIYERLVRRIPSGAKVTAIVDACRSGTVCDLPVIYDADGQAHARSRTASVPRETKRPYLGAGAFVLFSGSADHQMSADMIVEDEEGQRSVGIMTTSFVDSVMECIRQGGASYGQVLKRLREIVLERANATLPDGFERQEPQLSTSHNMDIWRTPFFM